MDLLLLLLSVILLVSGELDCSALTGAELQEYTGSSLSVYAENYGAAIVDAASNECIALFRGESRGHSRISRIFTFGVNDKSYRDYWREFPGDVAWRMALNYDFDLSERNIYSCTTTFPDLYTLQTTGFLDCSDMQAIHEDEFDEEEGLVLTVVVVSVAYICIALVIFTIVFSCCICKKADSM